MEGPRDIQFYSGFQFDCGKKQPREARKLCKNRSWRTLSVAQRLRLPTVNDKKSLRSSKGADDFVRLAFWLHRSGVSVENEFERLRLKQVRGENELGQESGIW